jgi:hypothetical protein
MRRYLKGLGYPPKGLGLRSHMENCRERCPTSKSVYEKTRNLSHAKINRDSHTKRTAGGVATTPVPERQRVGPALALHARSCRHSWSTVATWLWKNRSPVHLSFQHGNDERSRCSHFADLRRQIHNDVRVQRPEWVQPNGESPICDSYEVRLMKLLADLEEVGAYGIPVAPVHEGN